jgi:hypothetical protein
MDELCLGVFMAEVKKFIDMIDIFCNNHPMASEIYCSKNNRKEVSALTQIMVREKGD